MVSAGALSVSESNGRFASRIFCARHDGWKNGWKTPGIYAAFGLFCAALLWIGGGVRSLMVKFLGSGVIARMVNSITDAANESAVTRLTRKLQILDTVNLMLNYVIVWLFGWGIALL